MVDVVMESSIPMRDIGVTDEVVDKNKVLILPALEKVGGGGENIKAKKPQQPCYVCRNMWRKQMDSYVTLLNDHSKAPTEECTVVHVLSKQELADLCEHGAQVIHLDKPQRDKENNHISWNVITRSVFDDEKSIPWKLVLCL